MCLKILSRLTHVVETIIGKKKEKQQTNELIHKIRREKGGVMCKKKIYIIIIIS